MEKSTLQLAIADFAKQEFEIPEQAISYYIEGFCGDFSIALYHVLKELGEECFFASCWGTPDNMHEKCWIHDMVEWKGKYWDILGPHTAAEESKFWKRWYAIPDVEVRQGAGDDTQVLPKEIANVERKLHALLR